MTNSEIEQLSIDTIRTLSMDAVQQANAGHPGTAMSLAPLAYLLYTEVMKHNPANPHWPDRDRFVLSAGHACILQYSALHLAGYNLSLEEVKRFRQWESLTPGHPEVHHTPGIEATTGPLGQGFANGVGFGIAERFLAELFNRPYDEIVDHFTYVVCGDGDLMEGVSNEAASIAGTLGLGKLVYFYDDNHITIDGTTSISFTEDRGKRFEAQGWHVQHVGDANDLNLLREAIANAQAVTDKPSLVIIRSHIAFGAPRAVDTAKAHGSPLGEDEVRATKEALGWDPDETFYVPQGVYAHWREPAMARGAALQAEWQERFREWEGQNAELAGEWHDAWSGRPRAGFREALPEFSPDAAAVSTRKAAGDVMQAFAPFVPTMMGGAADLVHSTFTQFDGEPNYSAERSARNVAWGVREHGMGAALNGIALHGGVLKPFGSTFFVFTDYMRPPIRLSALMKLNVVWIFTHDSVAVGEDGPTHQPVEHLAAMRAIPQLTVIRPADANESSEMWGWILEECQGPVCLALSRQNVPIIDRSKYGAASGLRRGAYVLADADSPDVVLVATGAEVGTTLEARDLLAEQGIQARVVSMPSWELFEQQGEEYRESVLPPDVLKISVEAAVSFGWERWVDASVSIEKFGASGKGTAVLEDYGFSPRGVAERVQAKVAELAHR